MALVIQLQSTIQQGCYYQIDYSQQYLLGQGKFAGVYICKVSNTNQEFAAKLFVTPGQDAKESAEEAELMRKQIENELRVLAEVQQQVPECPFLDRAIEIFPQHQPKIAIMELCDGDLLKYMRTRNNSLSEVQAVYIALQVAQGLKVLHSAGYAHRDIKPENILVRNIKDEYPQVKLADFTTCKKITQQQPLLTSMIGTVNYMAPEYFTTENYDGKSVDVWALGIMLDELLHNFQFFYRGLKPEQIAQKICSEQFQVRQIIDQRSNSPRDVHPLTKRALEGMVNKNLELRFQIEDVQWILNKLYEKLTKQDQSDLTNQEQLDLNARVLCRGRQQLETTRMQRQILSSNNNTSNMQIEPQSFDMLTSYIVQDNNHHRQVQVVPQQQQLQIINQIRQTIYIQPDNSNQNHQDQSQIAALQSSQQRNQQGYAQTHQQFPQPVNNNIYSQQKLYQQTPIYGSQMPAVPIQTQNLPIQQTQHITTQNQSANITPQFQQQSMPQAPAIYLNSGTIAAQQSQNSTQIQQQYYYQQQQFVQHQAQQYPQIQGQQYPQIQAQQYPPSQAQQQPQNYQNSNQWPVNQIQVPPTNELKQPIIFSRQSSNQAHDQQMNTQDDYFKQQLDDLKKQLKEKDQKIKFYETGYQQQQQEEQKAEQEKIEKVRTEVESYKNDLQNFLEANKNNTLYKYVYNNTYTINRKEQFIQFQKEFQQFNQYLESQSKSGNLIQLQQNIKEKLRNIQKYTKLNVSIYDYYLFMKKLYMKYTKPEPEQIHNRIMQYMILCSLGLNEADLQ